MLQEKKLSSCCIHVAALPKLHYTTLRDLCSLCLCVNIWMVSCFSIWQKLQKHCFHLQLSVPFLRHHVLLVLCSFICNCVYWVRHPLIRLGDNIYSSQTGKDNKVKVKGGGKKTHLAEIYCMTDWASALDLGLGQTNRHIWWRTPKARSVKVKYRSARPFWSD